MTKRMLIDATHAEETRVVVLDGNRLEDFDVETAAKKQLKGNIYLAKVVRVEPSLQAAFVEYGGGRHGFLAFGEIHPDYYQIPVADRQRLLEMQEAEARAEEEAEDAAAAAAEAADIAIEAELAAGAAAEDISDSVQDAWRSEEALPFEGAPADGAQTHAAEAAVPETAPAEASAAEAPSAAETHPTVDLPVTQLGTEILPEPIEAVVEDPIAAEAPPAEPVDHIPLNEPADGVETVSAAPLSEPEMPESHMPESLGGAPSDDGDDGEDDSAEEDNTGASRRESRPPRFMRSYKIQEVIRRRQILLVQVVKEERGTKGAALTTFISLAGRFSVLMPNSPRGGGISRKITSAADRRRLKEVTSELQIPRGMGMIIRTAGAARPKAEIKRDCEYLLELWDSIRETTMASIAPALIHEEASLIKRAIRDNYSRDVDEVLVDGEAGWRAARDFMRMLMPAHARKVILWNEAQPLFARQNVEAHLDAMLQPTVQLRSGGYLVINQTEALVAIDVNSGRSTRERGIEETALKTNLEAADEVARQLRLRDLAGLIVIDFIDMESRRNNTAVEKRMKDALKDDRARIQMGMISHFGLMELSRQRLRPSLAETSFTTCPHCGGTGHVRTTETAALAVLRAVEDEGAKRRAAAIVVYVAGAVALYVLNHKRQRLAEIETRYGMSVAFAADESLMPPQTRIERVRPHTGEIQFAPSSISISPSTPEEDDLVVEEADTQDDEPEAGEESETELAPANETAEESEARRHSKRRRRRRGRREDGPASAAQADAVAVDPAQAEQPSMDLPVAAAPAQEMAIGAAAEPAQEDAAPGGTPEAAIAGESDEEGRARRRGRRGGRRRRKDPSEGEAQVAEPGAEAPASFEHTPAYTGPTPADPFGQVYDIFAIMDEAEAPAARPAPSVMEPTATQSVATEAFASEPVAAEPATPEPVTAEPLRPEPAPAEAMAEAVAPQPEAEAAAPEPPTPEPPAPQPIVTEAAPEVEVPSAVIEEAAEDGLQTLNGHAEPEPTPAKPALEPVSTPMPPPVLVGEAPAADKKRGWWRR